MYFLTYFNLLLKCFSNKIIRSIIIIQKRYIRLILKLIDSLIK